MQFLIIIRGQNERNKPYAYEICIQCVPSVRVSALNCMPETRLLFICVKRRRNSIISCLYTFVIKFFLLMPFNRRMTEFHSGLSARRHQSWIQIGI